MRKFICLLVLASTVALTACAIGPQPYWQGVEGRNRAQDDLECRAMANQAAMGAGAWSSSSPVQAAIRDHAAQQYFNQCVHSRGYQWVMPR